MSENQSESGESPILSKISELEGLIENLSGSLEAIDRRLEPISSSPEPADSEQSTDIVENSKVENELEYLCRLVEGSQRHINDIMDRLRI